MALDFPSIFYKKNAAVVGASSGIGSRVAIDLGELGSNVVLISRNKERLLSVADQITNHFVSCGDIKTVNGCKTIVKDISNQVDHIDYLVISAGVFKTSTILDASEKTWDYIFDNNLKGVFFFIQQLLPLLKKGVGKSIVVVSSILAHFGGSDVGLYSASKGGLSTLIKTLAIELSEYQIRVNAVSPGHIDTPLISELIKDLKFRKEVEKLYPLGRIGTTHDVSPLMIFLLSEYSSWITGCDYIVDGGRSASI